MNDLSAVTVVEDEPEEEWFPEFPGDTRYAFCDTYEAHDRHVYRALNGNTYDCSGMTAADVAEMEARAALPPCEHGLSADLCAGPGHYPADR